MSARTPCSSNKNRRKKRDNVNAFTSFVFSFPWALLCDSWSVLCKTHRQTDRYCDEVGGVGGNSNRNNDIIWFATVDIGRFGFWLCIFLRNVFKRFLRLASCAFYIILHLSVLLCLRFHLQLESGRMHSIIVYTKSVDVISFYCGRRRYGWCCCCFAQRMQKYHFQRK